MNADKQKPFVFWSDSHPSLLVSRSKSPSKAKQAPIGQSALVETLRLDRGRVRRGRPGLAGSAPSGLVAVGVPAANSLSRIFVRVGNGLNGPTFTIRCSALWIVLLGNCNPPVIPSTPSLTQRCRKPLTGSGIPVPP